MPIRREERARYPRNWKEISRRIRKRSGGRCECDGRCGRPKAHLARDGRCRNQHGRPAWTTGAQVVLTVAHLNHTPEDIRDENLLALCQACHLHYDRDQHARTRRATLARRRAAARMPGQEQLL
jgi:hypothetical protein